MNIPKRPQVGWGILDPDPTILPETLELLARLSALPSGQRDALLTQAVPRYLAIELELDEEIEPDKSQMVLCSNGISQLWYDLLGHR